MDVYRLVASLGLLFIYVFLVEWGREFGVASGSAIVLPYLVGVGVILLAFFLYNFVRGYRES
jgi:hypothetical protein